VDQKEHQYVLLIEFFIQSTHKTVLLGKIFIDEEEVN